jgi:acyl-CoA synthetase
MQDPQPLAAIVRRNAEAAPEGLAFAEAARGTAITWQRYDEWSSAMAATLAAAYAPGDRVAVQIPDGPGVHATMLACEKAGLVAVGIGARAGAREVAHIVERTGARTLLTVPPPDGGRLDQPGIATRDLWFLNSTSGTTGMPKIVMHDQARWFAFHELADEVAAFRDDDVFLSALPAPFGFGLWTAHFTPAIVGAPCIVCERFDAATVLAAVERYGVTVLAAVSTQFMMMLDAPAFARHDVSSLRLMFTGGEAVPFERAREFESRTNACVLQFYGSNETGALSRTSPADTQERRLTTAGRIIPQMHVRLVDPDTNEEIAPGTRAGIPVATGPTLCLGYWDDAEANAQLYTPDGAMRMGDLATIDDEGYLTVVGRTSDFIIRGGKNISAVVVEHEVGTHPNISLCAAVAIPDTTFGERVCVFAELRPGAEPVTLAEITAHLAARGTGKELWPERFVVLDALPRSSGGKVAKGELRARARLLA